MSLSEGEQNLVYTHLIKFVLLYEWKQANAKYYHNIGVQLWGLITLVAVIDYSHTCNALAYYN